MERRQFLKRVAVGTICAGNAGCLSDQSYRYRLTLALSVNGQTRSGTSVVAERLGDGLSLDGLHGQYIKTGEATLVRLDEKRALVATFTGGEHGPWEHGLPDSEWGQSPAPVLAKAYGLKQPGVMWLQDPGPTVELGPTTLPTIVVFRDISSPSSIVLVDPRDLQATCGPGVTWERAEISTTRDAVTWGIEKVLPWLRIRREYIEGRDPGSDSMGFQRADFIRGDLLRRG